MTHLAFTKRDINIGVTIYSYVFFPIHTLHNNTLLMCPWCFPTLLFKGLFGKESGGRTTINQKFDSHSLNFTNGIKSVVPHRLCSPYMAHSVRLLIEISLHKPLILVTEHSRPTEVTGFRFPAVHFPRERQFQFKRPCTWGTFERNGPENCKYNKSCLLSNYFTDYLVACFDLSRVYPNVLPLPVKFVQKIFSRHY